MAKHKPKRKPTPAKTPMVESLIPTAEQKKKGVFNNISGSTTRPIYRRVPVIDTMAQTGKLSRRQFDGLARYRDVAIAEERSFIEDSVGKMMRGACGGGDGTPSPASIRTAIEMGRLEHDLGALRDIARAVAVDDMTVSQWAASKGGTTTDGQPKRDWLKSSMMEIQMAGERLAASIGA